MSQDEYYPCIGDFSVPLPDPDPPGLTPTQKRDRNFLLYGFNSSGPPSPFDCKGLGKKSFNFLPELKLCEHCYNQTKIVFSKDQNDEEWKKLYLTSIKLFYGIEATISEFESDLE
jgi:hypothetical protein